MSEQSINDKKYRYFGSSRMFYSGLSLGSTPTYSYVSFSGTNTGFVLESTNTTDSLSQRFALASSGTSSADWTWTSGTDAFPHGTIYGGEAFVFDGVNRSGLWVRSSSAGNVIRVWAW